MAKVYLFVFCMLAVSLSAQTIKKSSIDSLNILMEKGHTVSMIKFGKTRIHFSDGSIYKHCQIKEINTIGIVYIKNGVLHDAYINTIEKIEFIEIPYLIEFDKSRKGQIKKNEENDY